MAELFYLINGIALTLMAIEFRKSWDSKLGKILTCMFLAWAWYQFGWFLNIVVCGHGVDIHSYLWCITNLPAVTMSLAFVAYNIMKKLKSK